MNSTIRILAALLPAALVVGACTADDPTTGAFSNAPAPTSTAIVRPLPPDGAPPPAAPMRPWRAAATGDRSGSCVEGWSTPPPGSPQVAPALDVILDHLEVDGRAVVGDVRIFDGPESPPSDKGYIATIRRWYVVLSVPGEPGAQGRFLVERRGFGPGLAAVASLGTRGFRSPDWIGFQYDPTAPLRRYPDLPGAWRGVPYDFVAGGEGLTIPGLPDEVVGCLDGT